MNLRVKAIPSDTQPVNPNQLHTLVKQQARTLNS